MNAVLNLFDMLNLQLSLAHGVFKLSNFLIRLHDSLLQNRLFSLQFQDLLLHVIILSILLADGDLQVFEVLHNVRVDNFDIFIVLGRQMVLHQSNLLPQQFNFFFVLTQNLLRGLNPFFDTFDVCAHTVVVGILQLGSVGTPGLRSQQHFVISYRFVS